MSTTHEESHCDDGLSALNMPTRATDAKITHMGKVDVSPES